MLRVLARLRRIRGAPGSTRSGYGADRRLERDLIIRYEAVIERIVAELDDRGSTLALEIARGPHAVRGYGPIKKAAAARAAEHEQRLLGDLGHAGALRRAFRRARARPSYRRLRTGLRRRRAADAAIGERLCDEPRHRNHLAAVAADPVRFVLDLIERLARSC